MMPRLLVRSLALVILLSAAIAAVADLSITRRGYWTVTDDQGAVISQHSEIDKAMAAAANWSAAHNGRNAEVVPPRYVISDVRPEPPVVEPPDPGPVDPGPVDPPASGAYDPAAGWTVWTHADPITLTREVDRAALQAALDTGRPVLLERGAVIEGGVVLKGSRPALESWGVGARPEIRPAVGQHGIDFGSMRIDEALVRGVSVRGPPALQSEVVGIRLRLNGNEGHYAKRVVIEDVAVDGFDTLIELVDDYSRAKAERDANKQPIDPGALGRLYAEVRRSILTNARGSDSHSSGIYLEGLVPGSVVAETVVHRVGWTSDGSDPRDKRSHCIYAQSLGSPLTVTGCLLSEASAKGLELRVGGVVEGCVVSRCSDPIGISKTVSRIVNSVVLDQTDIDPEVDADKRGKGIDAWNLPAFTMRGVVLARRGGSLARQPAAEVKGLGGAVLDVRGNAALAWSDAVDFLVGGVSLDGVDGNRVDVADRGVPAVTEDLLKRWTSRPAGVWGEAYELDGFVRACQAKAGVPAAD